MNLLQWNMENIVAPILVQLVCTIICWGFGKFVELLKKPLFLLTFNLVFRNILERVTKSVAYTAIIYIALTHRLTDCAPVPFGTGAFFMSYFSNRPFLRLV